MDRQTALVKTASRRHVSWVLQAHRLAAHFDAIVIGETSCDTSRTRTCWQLEALSDASASDRAPVTSAWRRQVPVTLDRCRLMLPGVWAGWLLCTAFAAAPSAFALLPAVDAGRLAARFLALDGYTSLAVGALLLLLERAAEKRDAVCKGARQFGIGTGLVLASLFCTLAGYFGVLPLMAAARAGQGVVSFGQLHAASAAFYLLKVLAVLALVWRAAGASGSARPPVSPRPSS